LVFRRGANTGGGADGIPKSTMALFCRISGLKV